MDQESLLFVNKQSVSYISHLISLLLLARMMSLLELSLALSGGFMPPALPYLLMLMTLVV